MVSKLAQRQGIYRGERKQSMSSVERQPHEHLRPALWAGRLALGRFVLTLSLKSKHEREGERRPISNRLAALRQERGLSREDLAEQLQIHISTLIAMENGSYLPSLRLALHLSEIFAQPIETIFFSPATAYPA